MSAIQIPNITPPTINPRQYVIVQVKRRWTDTWKTVQHISYMGHSEETAPASTSITLMWHWGQVKYEDQSTFAITNPQDIALWFVRVALVVESDALSVVPTTVPIVHGVISPSTHQILGDGTVQTGGDQELIAYGLEYLLDMVTLDQSYALPVGGSAPVAIDAMPDINAKQGGGYTATIGNRSSAKYDGPYGADLGQSYVFAQDGAAWTLENYVEYLLVNFPPGGPVHGDVPIALSGQTAALADITLPQTAQRWGTSGGTLRSALNDLISAGRGLGYTMRVTDVTDPDTGDVTGTALGVHVFSTSANAINVAGATLPANAQRVTFDPSTRSDAPQVSITLDPTADYDRLIVRGQNLLTCFSLSFDDATLVKGWIEDDETTYLAADTPTRSNDTLEHVYRRYMAPENWNFIAKYGYEWSSGVSFNNVNNANPGINKDGVVTPLLRGPIRNWGLKFERYIPLPRAASRSTQPELVEPLVWLKDTHNRYYQADVPPDDADLPGCSIRPASTGLAFELLTDPAHLLALNHVGENDTFDQAPAVDYETMVATLAVRTDQRLQVDWQINQSASTTRPGRTRIIEVPHAQAWYITPGTVFGLAENSLLRHPGGLVRDDSLILRSIASIAMAWYKTPRAKAQIVFGGLSLDYPLGAMIDAVVTALNSQAINSVVTRREVSITSDDLGVEYFQTIITTGFEDLDFVGLNGNAAFPDIKQLYLAEHEIKHTAGGALRAIKRNFNLPPARYLVKEIYDDHLICARWDGFTEGLQVPIARPETCRTDNLAGYSNASSVSVVDVQTVIATGTVDSESVSEVWRITPGYVADSSEIYATPVRRGSGTSTSYALVDDNRNGRQWVATTENPDDL